MPKLWAKSIGERGNRVRLYEPRHGGPLMRSIFLNGKEDRKSLGHRDKAQATAEAYELLAQLRADSTARTRGTLTVGGLVERYKQSPAFLENKQSTQDGSRSSLDRVMRFLGPDLDVSVLGPSDVKRFVHARRNGLVGDAKGGEGKKVRDSAIRADLVALMTALNWASIERDAEGKRLLKENPLRGVALPREKNPKRPVMPEETYQALLKVADQVHPQLGLALVLAEGTGRRLSSWRQLRWDDIDFESKPFGSIRWRAEYDKKGYEQTVPMSGLVRDALLEARRKNKAIGATWVFPAATDPALCTKRELWDQRLRRAYVDAKVTKEEGSLWHAIRRKWASERKGHPISDVAAAGGWRDKQTLLESYQRPDAETIEAVVLNKTRKIGVR